MPSSLTLRDYSDRELLHLIMDHAGPGGWAESTEIADALGWSVNGDRSGLQMVGARFGWLRRFGALERDQEAPRTQPSRWRVTPIGELLAHGKLSAREQAALEKLRPEQLLLVTRHLTGRYREAPETAGHLIRREWTRGAIYRLNGSGG